MIYSALKPQDYVREKFYSSAPMGFELQSSSAGIVVTSPTDLVGAVTIEEATGDSTDETINPFSETQKYVLYKSVQHNFFRDAVFYSGSRQSTQSLTPQPDDSYIVSVGRNFYGERIKPGSFELSINAITEVVNDDGYGNLFVSESGVGTYVGNIFYDDGVAVIKQDAAMVSGDVSGSGIKIIGSDEVSVDFSSDVQIIQHEIRVELNESQFNMSNNPSLAVDEFLGSYSQSLQVLNAPVNDDGSYNYFKLMGSRIIKPYMTTIGLYDDNLNLVAIGKVSTPIQRTFDTKQIFIVRFQETGYDGI